MRGIALWLARSHTGTVTQCLMIGGTCPSVTRSENGDRDDSNQLNRHWPSPAGLPHLSRTVDGTVVLSREPVSTRRGGLLPTGEPARWPGGIGLRG